MRIVNKANYDTNLLIADGLGIEKTNGINIFDIGKPRNRLIRMFITPLKILCFLIRFRASIYHIHDPELLPVGFLLQKLFFKKVIFDSMKIQVLLF